jgi:hypothetical protein
LSIEANISILMSSVLKSCLVYLVLVLLSLKRFDSNVLGTFAPVDTYSKTEVRHHKLVLRYNTLLTI